MIQVSAHFLIHSLYGHSDVQTIIIYIHLVKSVTLQEVKGPLDLLALKIKKARLPFSKAARLSVEIRSFPSLSSGRFGFILF